MFSEALNLAITRTELDAVFFQKFDQRNALPYTAFATTEAIFKQIATEHSAYIQSINKGSGLFPIIGETQTVPTQVPRVANKQTNLIKDFASAINFLWQLTVK